MKDRGSFFQSPLFAGLNFDEITEIAQLASYKRYQRGEMIFAAGESAQSIFILNDGHVKLLYTDNKGRETIIHIYGPNEIFGELLLAEEQRVFSAVAMEGALVSLVSKENFLNLLQKYHRLNLNFIIFLSEHIKTLKQELADFGHAGSFERLIKVLIKLAQCHGEKQPEGILIQLPLTHEVLANMISTSRETVTIFLNQMKKEGLIEIKKRNIWVKKEEIAQYMLKYIEKNTKKRGVSPSDVD